MTFRLTTLLWLFALAGSAMAAFDAWGLAAAGVVCLFWRCLPVFLRWRSRRRIVFAALAVLLLFVLLLPAVQVSRCTTRCYSCINNAKLIALALHLHDQEHGALPPATTRDANGTPLHSWRAAILPFLEYGNLHDAIDFSQPWDGPSNTAPTSPWVDLFECPGCWRTNPGAGCCPFAVTGPQTIWRTGEPRSIADVPDGAHATILLIEVAPIRHWAEPRDLTFNEAVTLLTSPIQTSKNGGHFQDDGYFYHARRFRHVVMADGSCHQMSTPLSRELAIALLTADGGEAVDLDELRERASPRLDYGRVGGLVLFVLVALLPARYAHWTPTQVRSASGGWVEHITSLRASARAPPGSTARRPRQPRSG
ncbi:MAG: DUF1559 domain-containing protein [Planctomycetota bacterium]